MFEHDWSVLPTVTVSCEDQGVFEGPNPNLWDKWPVWPKCVDRKGSVPIQALYEIGSNRLPHPVARSSTVSSTIMTLDDLTGPGGELQRKLHTKLMYQ